MGSNQLILHKNVTPISINSTAIVGAARSAHQFIAPSAYAIQRMAGRNELHPYMTIFLQVPQSSQAIRYDLGIVLGGIFSFEIAQFGQLGEDAGNALLNGLFIGFNH